MAPSLSAYFTAAGQAKALDAYDSFAKSSAWSVPNKMDLYAHSLAAFDCDDAEHGFQHFQHIYDNLASY